MYVPDLVEGYFSSIVSEKPRLFYADRLFGYKVRVGVLVEIVKHEENEAEGKPKRDKQRNKEEQRAQKKTDNHEDDGKFDKRLLHERLTTPKDGQTAHHLRKNVAIRIFKMIATKC